MATRILVVEDERIVAEDIKQTLEEFGYVVPAVASTGAEAIAGVRQHRPDACLMDIRIKGAIDGIRTASEVMGTYGIPVVFLTAYADEATLERVKATGPYGYLVKPFSGRELQAALEAALARHGMERKLAASERRWRTVLQSIGDAVVCVGGDGTIEFMNAVAEDLTGWAEPGVRGRPWSDVVVFRAGPAPDADVVASLEALTGRGDLPVPELYCFGRTGFARAVECTVTPVRGTEADGTGTVLVVRDVTVRRRFDAQAQRNVRLESLGLLAGGVAHDFNNLLAGMLASISLAAELTPPDDERRQLLSDVEAAATRARHLTGQLLAYAKGDTLQAKVCSLAEVARAAVRFSLRGTNVTGEVHLPDDLWPVSVDEQQVMDVLNNIVLNAVQAMPDGGSITVEGANERAPWGPCVRLSLADRGPGIPEAALERIFEPYFTTKPEGTGLGLATSFSVIRRHGGSIEAVNRPGGGAVFHIRLPSAEAAEPVEATVAPDLPVTRGGRRILVFDDDEAVRAALERLLAFLGFEVAVVTDTPSLLGEYRRGVDEGRPFAAVIMDLTVPGDVGGRQAVTKLLELDPTARAIVSTGYCSDPVLADPAAYGFVAGLPKPYNLNELQAVLGRVLGD